MAGISVIVVSLLLMFILVASFIGFILFLVSMILFLKKKKVQSDGKIKSRKKIAIIILIISLIFQIPLILKQKNPALQFLIQKNHILKTAPRLILEVHFLTVQSLVQILIPF